MSDDDAVPVDAPPVTPITVHNKGPVTNELLCYVSCKIRICTFDVIVKMCTDFYDTDFIAAAKDALMECVTLPEADKRSGRRRANLKEVHMKDIVSILLEIKPEDVPLFLASDLNNVPPMSLNNFDMSRIITDMEVLKSQMKSIQEAQETALRAHVALCRETTNQSNSTPVRAVQSPVTSSIQHVSATSDVEHHSTDNNNGTANNDVDNERHQSNIDDDADAEAAILRLAQTQGLILDHSRRTPRRPSVPRTVRQREAQLDEHPEPEPPTSDSSYAAALRRQPPPMIPNRTNNAGRSYHNDRRPRGADGADGAGRDGGSGAAHRARTDRNGRDKNINNGVITGNGEYFDLRAAPQAQRKKKQRVGLFPSRVRPDFRCRDVVSHVRQVTGLTVRCEPIPTRYDTYRSYCVRGSPREIDRLMDGSLWPRGVIVKEYTKFI